ncbi:MAG: stalk domain-containing protein [Lachnospirales bacterium]
MKLRLLLFVCLMAVSAIVPTFANNSDIRILVNNQPVESETNPVVIDGTTFVPLRPVAEAMGCEVFWIAQSQTINMRNKTTIIAMQVGNDKISRQKRTSEGTTTVLKCENPPRIIDGSTYIPLRSMAEAFGATVAWDANSRTVIIVYDTTIKYAGNKTIKTYAGHGARKRYDSTVDKMEFLSPESMDISDDGSIYISDSGAIRKISSGKSETIEFEPSYISSAIVRCYKNDIYFTTNAFEDEKGEKYYGIVKLTDGIADGIYITEAVYSKITDFDIDSKGIIYALIYNSGVGKNYIAKFNKDDMQYLKEVDEGFTCMTIDKNDNIFVGNSVRGSLYCYNTSNGEFNLFAGVDDNTRFVDGPDPMFFEPRSLYYKDNSLYIMDYNLLRRIEINNGNVASYSETLAGKISTEVKPVTQDGKASEAEIAPSYLMEIGVFNGKVYITDPVNDVLRVVE